MANKDIVEDLPLGLTEDEMEVEDVSDKNEEA